MRYLLAMLLISASVFAISPYEGPCDSASVAYATDTSDTLYVRAAVTVCVGYDGDEFGVYSKVQIDSTVKATITIANSRMAALNVQFLTDSMVIRVVRAAGFSTGVSSADISRAKRMFSYDPQHYFNFICLVSSGSSSVYPWHPSGGTVNGDCQMSTAFDSWGDTSFADAMVHEFMHSGGGCYHVFYGVQDDGMALVSCASATREKTGMTGAQRNDCGDLDSFTFAQPMISSNDDCLAGDSTGDVDTCAVGPNGYGDSTYVADVSNFMSYCDDYWEDFTPYQIKRVRCWFESEFPDRVINLGDTVAVGDVAIVGYSTNSDPLLGIPRYRGGRYGDTLVMIISQNGSSSHVGWAVSTDSGKTFTGYNLRWMQLAACGGTTWYSQNHVSAWMNGEGFGLATRNYNNDSSFMFRYMAASSGFDAEADWTVCADPTEGYGTYYPIIVGASDDWWVVDASETGDSNLFIYHSDDNFSTFTRDTVCAPPAGGATPQDAYRLGAVMDTNGYPIVAVFDYSNAWRFYRSADGTTWTVDTIPTAAGSGDRSFAFNQVNGVIHMVHFEDNTDDIIHFKQDGEGGWDSVVAVTMANGDNDGHPQIVVHGNDFYMVFRVPTDSMVCIKKWDAVDGWDTDSIQISESGHHAKNCATFPEIPGAWTTIPFMYDDMALDSIYTVPVTVPAGD